MNTHNGVAYERRRETHMARKRLTDEQVEEIVTRVVHEEVLKFQAKLLAKLRTAGWA